MRIACVLEYACVHMRTRAGWGGSGMGRDLNGLRCGKIGEHRQKSTSRCQAFKAWEGRGGRRDCQSISGGSGMRSGGRRTAGGSEG